ncbi:MAG TPA: TIGR00730 family Rossman fold protein [Egibacteraceae bacterium]|nr:TIGR00730 family Rossman fold protein [Egibacteraceae bacterium]
MCVYCASSQAVDPAYRQVAAQFGRALAAQGWGLVYGGGNVGLMGEVARAALAAGAAVTGVIPDRLAVREIALHHAGVELIRTDTVRERKAIMDERSDAFVVLPGGIGTLEELVEILTLKQLGYHDRAIVVLDSKGYWDPLLAQLERMIDERLAYPELRDLLVVTHDVAQTVEALRTYTPPAPRRPLGVELEGVEPPRNQQEA